MAVFKVITEVPLLYQQHGITKKYHDEAAIADVISYILNAQKTQGKYFGGLAVNLNVAAEQMQTIAAVYGKTKGIHLRHMVLSLSQSERVTPDQAQIIAYRAACWYASEYQIIYAVHTGGENLHIHFVMNTVSYMTGKKYEGKKQDYYAFQTYLKDILLDYGIMCLKGAS